MPITDGVIPSGARDPGGWEQYRLVILGAGGTPGFLATIGMTGFSCLRLDRRSNLLQVVDEAERLEPSCFVARRAEDRRRMHGRRHELGERRFHELTALNGDAKFRADHGLGRGRSEADDGARLDDIDFGLQPRHAGIDLDRVRLFVNAPFAARLPLEVLHDIRDVDLRAIDACFFERFVEQSAGRTDEGTSGEIFFVARLLADEHHRRRLLSFAENGLRCAFVQVTGRAIPRGLSHGREAR